MLIGYVTLEEADAYIASRYLASDALRINWELLEDEDKKVYLTKSMDALEELPFVGRKTSIKQPHAFPRYPDQQVPELVKYAQIENALSLSDDTASADAAEYDRLWKFGVSSYSIGNLTETSADGSWGHAKAGNAAGVTSTRANVLLSRYLNGGYRFE